MRRSLVNQLHLNGAAGIVIALAIGVIFLPQPAQPQWPGIELIPFAAGFLNPVHITHCGDGSGRLFVVEQRGLIRIIKSGAVLPLPFIDLQNRVLSGGEQGLLSVAFPPQFQVKRHFYVNYTRKADGATVISRFSLTGDPDLADPQSEQILLIIEQPFENHNGGQLAFSPQDGFLYVGMGDGGSGGDPQNYAQNLNELTGNKKLLGKLLRIDVESGINPYAIPGNNPVLYNVRSEIWAMGLRNPWRFSFDRITGDLYIGDVGQNTREEINFQPSLSPGGENYGWRIIEGSLCFNPSSGCVPPANYAPPIAEYDHTEGCSVTGGFVYRGNEFPLMQGIYFLGDLCTGKIWGLKRTQAIWEIQLLADTAITISTFGEGEGGDLYVANYADGSIYKIGQTGIPQTFPDITVNPVALEFGNVTRGTSSDEMVTVRNDGSEDLILGTVTLPSPPFFKVSDNCSNQTLAPDESCGVTIRFLPPSIGDFNGNFSIPSDDPDRSIVDVPLSGRGVEAPAITSAASTPFAVGSAGSFIVATTGSPTPAITRGGASLPAGVTFVDNGDGTGTLGGTPAARTQGTYNLTFTASNGVSPDATQDFTLTVDSLAPILLISPSDQAPFDACSVYSLPTFAWSAEESFKSYEIQLSSEGTFGSIGVKVKVPGTATQTTMKSAAWKKILLIPGSSGGTVYWRVVGTTVGKSTVTSEVGFFMIGPPQDVGDPVISPTRRQDLPALFWDNNCNIKFKVWFGSDENFARKRSFTFYISNPNENGGEFSKTLSPSRWRAIRRLVDDTSGSTIYWYVESWDALKIRSQTDLMSFVLLE